ncbi:MAG: hypothetical protein HYX69_20150 [Planctomycetia bacterium]|nr:hypothetical protein [Planctomycetia bacterium]
MTRICAASIAIAFALVSVQPSACADKVTVATGSIKAHPCKIVNDAGTAVRVKIVGYHEGATYFIPLLPKGAEVITAPGDELREGERVVIAWDNPTGKILFSASATINEPKILTIDKKGLQVKTYVP